MQTFQRKSAALALLLASELGLHAVGQATTPAPDGKGGKTTNATAPEAPQPPPPLQKDIHTGGIQSYDEPTQDEEPIIEWLHHCRMDQSIRERQAGKVKRPVTSAQLSEVFKNAADASGNVFAAPKNAPGVSTTGTTTPPASASLLEFAEEELNDLNMFASTPEPDGSDKASAKDLGKSKEDADTRDKLFLLDMALLADMVYWEEGYGDSKKVGEWELKRSFDYSYDQDRAKYISSGGDSSSCVNWFQLVSLYANGKGQCAVVWEGSSSNPEDNWFQEYGDMDSPTDFNNAEFHDAEDKEGRALEGYKIFNGYLARFMQFVKGQGYRKHMNQYKDISEMQMTNLDKIMSPADFLKKLAETPYNEFQRYVKQNCAGKAFFVGHGMGGALASIAATYATRTGDMEVAGLYTFGAPGITYAVGADKTSEEYLESPMLGLHSGDMEQRKLQPGTCFPGYRVYNEDKDFVADAGPLLGSHVTAHPKVAALRLSNIGNDPDRPSQTIDTTTGGCGSLRSMRAPQQRGNTPSMKLHSMEESYIPRIGKLASLCRKCHFATGKQCRRVDAFSEMQCDGDATCNAISMCECQGDKCLINGVCADKDEHEVICQFLKQQADDPEEE